MFRSGEREYILMVIQGGNKFIYSSNSDLNKEEFNQTYILFSIVL